MLLDGVGELGAPS